jgi:transposase-like protein
MTFTTADLSSTRPEDAAGVAAAPTATRPGHATRRVFSPNYKLRIVDEYDALAEHGARGALLRREGLYQSHIEKWRRARDRGVLAQPKDPMKEKGPSAEAKEIRRLTEENARLAGELEKTNAVVEVLGKAYALLEVLSGSAEQPTRPTRSSTGR